jgi:hypothetical protein
MTWRARVVAGMTVAAWLALAAFIASSYVGHSSSPYGTCYAPSGRSIPCELAKR